MTQLQETLLKAVAIGFILAMGANLIIGSYAGAVFGLLGFVLVIAFTKK